MYKILKEVRTRLLRKLEGSPSWAIGTIKRKLNEVIEEMLAKAMADKEDK